MTILPTRHALERWHGHIELMAIRILLPAYWSRYSFHTIYITYNVFHVYLQFSMSTQDSANPTPQTTTEGDQLYSQHAELQHNTSMPRSNSHAYVEKYWTPKFPSIPPFVRRVLISDTAVLLPRPNPFYSHSSILKISTAQLCILTDFPVLLALDELHFLPQLQSLMDTMDQIEYSLCCQKLNLDTVIQQ